MDLQRDELADEGAVGFTDDGLPVRSAGLLRHALSYQRLAGRVLALHEEDPTLSGAGVMHEGAASALLGLAGLVVAIVALRNAGWTQAAAALVSLVVLYLGAQELGRARFGPRFDLLAWLCVGWLVLIVGAAVLAPWLPLPEHEDLAALCDRVLVVRQGRLHRQLEGAQLTRHDLTAACLRVSA